MEHKDHEIASLKAEIASLQNENTTLKKIITLMPGNVYWKDRDGKYQGCNQNDAVILSLKSPEEIIDKTVHDLLEQKYAEPIEQADNEIMATNQEKTIEEEVAFLPNGEKRFYMSSKNPFLDKEKNLIGVFGITIDITDRKKMEEELRIAKEKAEAALQAKEMAEAETREKSKLLINVLEELRDERYYLSGKYQGVHLTQREAQCLVCLAHGYSNKQTGKKLDLSPRTVEVYLNRVKAKLKCSTKTELIAKAIECRFLEGIRPVIPNT